MGACVCVCVFALFFIQSGQILEFLHRSPCRPLPACFPPPALSQFADVPTWTIFSHFTHITLIPTLSLLLILFAFLQVLLECPLTVPQNAALMAFPRSAQGRLLLWFPPKCKNLFELWSIFGMYKCLERQQSLGTLGSEKKMEEMMETSGKRSNHLHK